MSDSARVVEAEEARSERFNTLVGVMIAIVTIVGALVAWRSAVAGTEAGNEDDAGILAALNFQESSTISDIISSQNRTNFLSYWTNKQYIAEMEKDGTFENIPPEELDALVREVTEVSDLATANKGFFPSRYLNPDGTYNSDRERGENLAEAAETKDLNAQARFDAANAWREKSLLLVGALFLLAISLWLFAAAETFEHRVQYALASGGFAFLILGAGVSWAVETGGSVPDLTGITYIGMLALLGATLVGVIISFVLPRSSAPVATGDGDDSPAEVRFKQAATLAIATLALLGAGAAWLQTDAGNRGDAAIRRAQLLAAESLGVQSTGEAGVNFQWGGAAQTYEELSVLANAAAESGDLEAQNRYLILQSGVISMSELLRPPYFDPASAEGPDIGAYQADRYVGRAAMLSESSALGGELENAWEAKGNAYIIHLTLIATALALFGLALTMGGRVRPLFVGVGSLISVITVVWMGITYVQPIVEIPQTAVDAYGRGVGAAYRNDYAGAVTAFDEAIASAPVYGNALYQRAGAYYALGELDKAAADFKAAQGAGRDNATVAWELGLTYYSQGDFERALEAYRAALALDPKRVSVRLDIAIALLASGKIEEARAAYQASIDGLSAQVAEAKAQGAQPSPSIWYYIDTGADDLEGLFYQVSGEPRDWTSAPPRDKIASSPEVLAAIEEEFFTLKNLSVALEYAGTPVTGALAAEIGEFRFGTASEEDAFDISDTFPSETQELYTIYNYDGMTDGQQVIWKVFVDGVEYPEYRTVTTWSLGASGETAQTVTDDFAFSSSYAFPPGEYTVEMYVDSQMAQRGYFTVEQSEAAGVR